MKGKSLSLVQFLMVAWIIVVASVGTIGLPVAEAASEKTIVLKVSSYLPETTNESKVIKWWGGEVEKRTENAVKIEYYFAESLVKTMDTLPAVSSGIADIQFVADGYFPSQLPLMGGLHLLYQTESGYLMDKACLEMHASFTPFQNMMKMNNIKSLVSLSAGEVTMASVKPINSLEDLKGKKIRAMGLMNDALKKLGATPVAMPLPEVYEALERGTLDVVTGIPYHLISAFKFHEVAKNIVGIRMGCYASGGYYLNLDTWKKLPPHIQQVIDEVNGLVPDVYVEMTNQLYANTTRQLKESGCHIYSLSNDEFARWKTVLVPGIYDEWIAKMEKQKQPGRETLETYRALIAKYQSSDKYQSPFSGE
jgi:TRAP-type transport system periplasmic protein